MQYWVNKVPKYNLQTSYLKVKCRTPNEQFGASGGADSSDTEQVTSSFALVRALPMPPPAAKLPPRWLQGERYSRLRTVFCIRLFNLLP